MALLALAALPLEIPARAVATLGSTRPQTQPPLPQQTALLPKVARLTPEAVFSVALVALLLQALAQQHTLAAMEASRRSSSQTTAGLAAALPPTIPAMVLMVAAEEQPLAQAVAVAVEPEVLAAMAVPQQPPLVVLAVLVTLAALAAQQALQTAGLAVLGRMAQAAAVAAATSVAQHQALVARVALEPNTQLPQAEPLDLAAVVVVAVALRAREAPAV